MKKMKKRFNLKEEYIKSLNYIKDIKNFIFIIILVFFLFVFIGYFIPAPEYLENEILRFIQELLEKTEGMSPTQLIRFIFFNNLINSFLAVILGFFLGIFPLISGISNGYILGFISSLSVQSEGVSVLYRLLPHGIFELSAVFISLGMGLKLGTFIFRKNRKIPLKEYFLNSLRTFILIVIPLLIIAAIIEGSLIFFYK